MKDTCSVGRTRNFATIVYPESAPDNWLDILRDSCLNIFISPLHDSDINPDGEIKKPHYHVLVMYDSMKSQKQFLEFAETFGGVGQEKVNSTRGYARYLCHLDNPEKHRYSENDVIVIGATDYLSIISLPTDKYENIREMIDFIKENNISVFSDLLEYCSINNENWFRCLCDNGTYVIKEYLKSATYKSKS